MTFYITTERIAQVFVCPEGCRKRGDKKKISLPLPLLSDSAFGGFNTIPKYL